MFQKFEPFHIVKYLFLLILIAFVSLPLIATFLGGFKTLGDLRTNPFGLPNEWLTEYYFRVLFGSEVWLNLWNSIILSFSTVVLTLLVGSTAAFVFAHIHFFGKRMIYAYLLLGLMFPGATAILPLFITVRDLGLLDTYSGVIIPQVAFGLGFSVLLFKTFFEDLPRELFEAAFVDGCGYMQFYWRFTLPLSTPILATIGIFSLVGSWNSYIFPLILINSNRLYPWTLGMMQYRGEYGTQWNLILAFITITIIPAIAVFLGTQKYIITGLTGGAVKG